MAEVSHGEVQSGVGCRDAKCVLYVYGMNYRGVQNTCAMPTRSVHVRVTIATGRCFSHKVLCAMGERTNDTEPAVLTAFNVRDSESFNVLFLFAILFYSTECRTVPKPDRNGRYYDGRRG